jgi:hypothetical protein
MRILVKRCKVWWSTERESLDAEMRKLITYLDLPMALRYGVNAKCPFCGGCFFAEESIVPRAFDCPCGAVLRVKPMRAVKKIKRRLPKPSRKVELLCRECGWEGVWGLSETVRCLKENDGWLDCPECWDTPHVETRKGLPRYVTESSVR